MFSSVAFIRTCCFEIRTLHPGHFAMLKRGNLVLAARVAISSIDGVSA
jgi:hypothetical protein